MASSSAAHRLDRLLSLMRDASAASFLGARSFVHELEAKHEQQAARGGGFTRFDGDTSTFTYRVPERVCISGGRMPLSAILSIVDETTSWTSVGVDRYKRPGVSISLQASLVPGGLLPQPGQLLIFENRCERIGRTLGFQSCSVRDESGAMVASARHTKLLDMGQRWNWLMGPMFPVTHAVGKALGVFDERPLPKLMPNLAKLLAPEALEVKTLSASELGLGDVRNLRAAIARHTVTPPMLNEVRILFGGCQAMLHEQGGAHAAAAVGALADDPALNYENVRPTCTKKAGQMVLIGMDVSYLSGAALGDQLMLFAEAKPEVSFSHCQKTSSIVAISRLAKMSTQEGPSFASAVGAANTNGGSGRLAGVSGDVSENRNRLLHNICSEARMRYTQNFDEVAS
mmetsp:Transcript_29158/g.89324  ORF Transcript_29158/g.89324 Transcript_29158/m.89324 type:complete len:400 (+) Transcript_29158:89-1288(+)